MPCCRNILRCFTRGFMVFVDVFSGCIFYLINCNRTKKLPSLDTSVLLLSASALAKNIREQKLKSEDVVKAYIAQINKVNGILNAVVDTRFESAIQEAQNIDLFIASGGKSTEEIFKETPFLGVPFTCKECISAKGLHHSAGLLSRKDVIATSDAPALHLLKGAGAILLGNTNIPELCLWFDCYNKVYGKCRNPYATRRTPGGSSGGQASIVASAGSPFGLGSDMAGSIRMPCFFNGVFGHVSTSGIVPNQGHFPDAQGVLRDYLIIGPICRYATDLIPICKVLTRENGEKLKLDQQVDLKQLKIYYMENDCNCIFTGSVHPEIKASIRRVAAYFESNHGVKCEKVDIKEFSYSCGIWQAKMITAMKDKPIDEIIGDGKGAINSNKELAKWCVGCSDLTFPTIMNSLGSKIANRAPGYLQFMEGKFVSLRDRLVSLLGENGILLYPPHPRPAPYSCQPIFQSLNFMYTAVFNLLGLPVTQCPLGLGTKGIPLGVQVVANHFQDHITMAVAVELEKAFGGWVPPFFVSEELNNFAESTEYGYQNQLGLAHAEDLIA